MSKYLLEIGTEEIPARFLPNILKEYKKIFEVTLKENRIAYDSVSTYATPRRISIIVEGIASMQESLEEEIKGPAKKIAYNENNQPSKALEGFMRGNHVQLDDLFEKEHSGAVYMFALRKEEGRETKLLLQELLPKMILSAFFPKTMRWGDYNLRYVRPLKWLVSLWDDELLAFDLEMKAADRISKGHRFLSTQDIVISSVDTYFDDLRKAFVIVDQHERLDLIKSQLKAQDEQNHVKTIIDEDLLTEVLFLVEYPEVLMGDFDSAYLKIPQGLVVTPMKDHQRYFPVADEEGHLLNHFVTVRNGTKDYIDVVKKGNERVLEARLADAKFFYDEDLKIVLEDNLEKLKKITFQEKLGTAYQKMERVYELTKYLGQDILCYKNGVVKNALIAARLSKADLVSNVVMEFPELQGIMGEEYALKTMNTPIETAQAIREHYLPRFAGDKLPETKEGVLTSLADKIDTIVGCFAAGIEPTGSQDPYALRRQCMGVVQIIIHEKAHFSIKNVLNKAMESLAKQLEIQPNLLDKIYEFFNQRLLTYLKDQNYELPFIRAILKEGYDDIYECSERAHLLNTMVGTAIFENLEQTYKRVNNMLSKQEPVDVTLNIIGSSESALINQIQTATKIENLLERINQIASLSDDLNLYMDNTMIMVEDISVRKERLAVLKMYKNLFTGLIDFNEL